MAEANSTSRSESDKQYYLANREAILERVRLYRVRNQEKLRAYDRLRYRTNREQRLAKNRAHYAANRKKILAQQAKYAASHRDQKRRYDAERNIIFSQEHVARSLAWARAHPDKRQVISSRYRANKATAPFNDFTSDQWSEMKAAYDYRCAYCERQMARLTQDHIIPLSKGGPHTASNIVPACRRCNSKKGARGVLKPVQPLLLTISQKREV